MADDHAVIPIRSPWRHTLLASLKQVQHVLFMICPYIKDDVMTAMKDALLAREMPSPFEMRVITRALPDDFLSGSSDITSLLHVLQWPNELPCSSVEVRIINNIHAKVWLFDHHLAIVGSGNATSSSLDANLEYGLAVSDASVVAHIQQDWQSCWEQATPTNAQELEQMRQWLASMSANEAYRQLEAEVNEKRKSIERVIGQAPRIGKRLPPTLREPEIKQPGAFAEASGIYTSTEGTELLATSQTPEVPTVEPPTTKEHISLFAHELWQALYWTFPLNDEELHDGKSRKDANTQSFLKLAWLPTSSTQGAIQCIWADGKRYSQATIAAQSTNTQSAWAITLTGETIRVLGTFLQEFLQGREATSLEAQKEPDLDVFLQTSPYQLSLTQHNSTTANNTITLPCMQASLPGGFPSLRPPISQVTLENSALTALLEKLTALVQTRHESHEREYAPLSVVECNIDNPGKLSSITLSINSPEGTITDDLPANDCVLAGPPITFRFDYMALRQVLVGAEGKVDRWHIRIDRNADVAQFVPEPPILEGVGWGWWHQVWNVVG